jgi:hypothetical protein
MRKGLAAAAVSLALWPASAFAQERAGDAALGALSGGLVLGPVGAVAGAVVGYTAGPTIARSWGLRRSEPYRVHRSVKRPTQTAAKQSVSARAETPPASNRGSRSSAKPPEPPRIDMPPVQPLE